MNEKLGKCKACNGEIAKNAKSCPHCGAKVKKFPTALIVILALIVVIAIASASGNDEPKLVDGTTPTQSQTPDAGASNEKTTFKVGEIAELKDVLVKFVGFTESSGSKYNKPKDNHIFVLCEFEIANNSDDELAISSMLSFKGYCDDYTCEYSLGALLEKDDKNQLDGTVAAGKKMKGVIGYEIPKDWKELEIQFTPDFWSGRDILFVATNK
ncbi:MAG: DUF5067 domain-containing protein [Oscillospiraceae bacterium]|nr:DUF5067 domain-containing protein [Oscillospiraceae bacterium]